MSPKFEHIFGQLAANSDSDRPASTSIPCTPTYEW